jgi:hypothetical protein
MPTFQGATYIHQDGLACAGVCLSCPIVTQASSGCSVCSETCTACDYTRLAKRDSQPHASAANPQLCGGDGGWLQLTSPSAAACSVTMMIHHGRTASCFSQLADPCQHCRDRVDMPDIEHVSYLLLRGGGFANVVRSLRKHRGAKVNRTLVTFSPSCLQKCLTIVFEGRANVSIVIIIAPTCRCTA